MLLEFYRALWKPLSEHSSRWARQTYHSWPRKLLPRPRRLRCVPLPRTASILRLPVLYLYPNVWDCCRTRGAGAGWVHFLLSWLRYLVTNGSQFPGEACIVFFTKSNYFWDLRNGAETLGSVCLGNCDSKSSPQRTETKARFITGLVYIF